jgi:hypothetical protein
MRVTIRTWSEEDIRQLRQLIESGGSPERASVRFKRSINAVRIQAGKMGLKIPDKRIPKGRWREGVWD